jgi:hypothetical protein
MHSALKSMSANIDNLITELNDLDKDLVEIDGTVLKPSQCYHFETNPVHMLFNTNCPEALKQKIQAILAKHLASYESSS